MTRVWHGLLCGLKRFFLLVLDEGLMFGDMYSGGRGVVDASEPMVAVKRGARVRRGVMI